MTDYTPAKVLDAYGQWIAGLAPWTHFVTPTHRPPVVPYSYPARYAGARVRVDGERIKTAGLSSPRSHVYSRVGVGHSRRALRRWFHETVRALDPGAVWWSEMELHKSGQPHHHGLLAVRPGAPWLKMRSAWFRAEGYMRMEPIENAADVAAYCAKYATKSAAWEPCIWGVAP